MRAKEYLVLSDAVAAGVQYGWNRAHKHDAEPPDHVIIEEIEEAVLTHICERFIFDDEFEETPEAEG